MIFAALMGAASIQGCAVFEPVGGFFAQGYRNTVTYFNSYYNARRLFDAAEEEIRVAERQRLLAGTTAPQPGQPATSTIPPGARQKLNSVIDKCSNILAFHGKSDYVDDALFLIARSYFLQSEYVKSERKCLELIDQYPQSDLANETRVWLGRSLFEQSRLSESEQALVTALEVSKVEADVRTQAMSLESLSAVKRKQGDTEAALRYATQLRTVAPDNESVAAAMMEEAQLLLDEGRVEQALEPLSSIPQVTDDPLVLFDAEILKVEALRRLKRFAEALTVVEEAEQDFRFRDRMGTILLERARLLDDSGRYDDAIVAYTTADTSFPRTPSASAAAFDLGTLYEYTLGDYRSALKQYERAAAIGNFPASLDGRRRAALFNRYFQLYQRKHLVDSAIVLAGSIPQDSTGQRPNAAVLDSLHTVETSIMQDLGEWFYSEAELPDSAAKWLLSALNTGRVHRSTARGLYIMVDLARADSTGQRGSPEMFLQRIVDEFPETPYAVEARKQLGLPDDLESRDRPGQLYRWAEEDLEKGAFEAAARKWDSLVVTYPASPLVVKSIYASGWVYDNRLNRPDSAVNRYKVVVLQHGATGWAEAARKRITEIGTIRSDTTAPPPTAPINDEKPFERDAKTTRYPERKIPAKVDTLKSQVID